MSEKRPYKVILESITQEKKKLRAIISYDNVAPNGYTFVPVGAPELTEFCKEMSRQRGLNVHVVSAKPKNKAHEDPKNISHHIHRIGYHFRNDIVDSACVQTGFTINKDARVSISTRRQGLNSSAIARRLDRHGKRLGFAQDETDPQRQKETVTASIKDLFPKMPEVDQKAIIERAFKEGTDRVGTRTELSLPRRVQLAVTAHIRHTKTDYDALLRRTSWLEARRQVEQACLDQIVHWRGEGDEDADGELEDIFQEVIVLDDDTEDSRANGMDTDRDSSLEIISDRRRPLNSDVNVLHQQPFATNRVIQAGESPDIISVIPTRPHNTSSVLIPQDIPLRLQGTRARIKDNAARSATQQHGSHALQRREHVQAPAAARSSAYTSRLQRSDSPIPVSNTYHGSERVQLLHQVPLDHLSPSRSLPNRFTGSAGPNFLYDKGDSCDNELLDVSRFDSGAPSARGKPFYVPLLRQRDGDHMHDRLIGAPLRELDRIQASIELPAASAQRSSRQIINSSVRRRRSSSSLVDLPDNQAPLNSHRPDVVQYSDTYAHNTYPEAQTYLVNERSPITRRLMDFAGHRPDCSQPIDLTQSSLGDGRSNRRYHPYQRSSEQRVRQVWAPEIIQLAETQDPDAKVDFHQRRRDAASTGQSGGNMYITNEVLQPERWAPLRAGDWHGSAHPYPNDVQYVLRERIHQVEPARHAVRRRAYAAPVLGTMSYGPSSATSRSGHNLGTLAEEQNIWAQDA